MSGRAALALGLGLTADQVIRPYMAERTWARVVYPFIPNFQFFWMIDALTDDRVIPLPFLASIVLFLLGYLGLVISTFPYLVPPTLTIWQTAAAPASQIFMLLGTLVLLPVILGYITFVYWLFRGKVREGEGYH